MANESGLHSFTDDFCTQVTSLWLCTTSSNSCLSVELAFANQFWPPSSAVLRASSVYTSRCHTSATVLDNTRVVQPMAACRQSPYLHKPAIIVVMSFSLWHHLLLSWPRPALRTNVRTLRRDTLPRFIYKDSCPVQDPGSTASLIHLLILINSGSWYHCLAIGIYHWLGEGGCITAVCEVLCCTEARPGLSVRKWGGTSASRDENGQMNV